MNNAQKLASSQWRTENLYYIRNKDGEKVRFNRNEAQRDFNEKKGKRNIILKSRQIGFTTDSVISMVDSVLFVPGYKAIIIAHNLEDAQKIFDEKVSYAFDNLGESLKDMIDITQDKANHIKINHGSGENSSLTVASSARSGTLSHAHISELPRLEETYPLRAKEVFEGTLQSVPINGTVTIEGTPRQENDIFHRKFMTAWDKQLSGEKLLPTDYRAFFYSWKWDKEGISQAPNYESVPKEIEEYAKKHKLTEQERNYYYFHYLDVDMNFNSMYKEYPTTVGEAFMVARDGAVLAHIVELWYNNDSITRVPYDPMYPVYVVQDIGVSDHTSIIWVQKIGESIHIIDFYTSNYNPTSHYVDVIRNKPYRCDLVFLPHDAGHRNLTNMETVQSYYTNAGLQSMLMDKSTEQNRLDAIERRASAILIDKGNCEGAGIADIDGNKGMITLLKKVHRKKPGAKLHHGKEHNTFDALGYLCLIINDINYYNNDEGSVFIS